MKECKVKRIRNNNKKVAMYVVNMRDKGKFILVFQGDRNPNMTRRDKKETSRELREIKKNLNCILETIILTNELNDKMQNDIKINNCQHVTLKLTHGEEGDREPPIYI